MNLFPFKGTNKKIFATPHQHCMEQNKWPFITLVNSNSIKTFISLNEHKGETIKLDANEKFIISLFSELLWFVRRSNKLNVLPQHAIIYYFLMSTWESISSNDKSVQFKAKKLSTIVVYWHFGYSSQRHFYSHVKFPNEAIFAQKKGRKEK